MLKKILIVCIIGLLFTTFTTTSGLLQNSTNKVEIKDCLPASFSWHDINGMDYTTPVKDQSPAPTCEAYALCASLETLMQYKTGELYQPDLSETHLYFYANGTYEKGAVNLIDAAEYLVEYGVPDEGVYPDPHRAFDYPFESLEGWENRTVKIESYGWVEHDEQSIKEALIEYGPLVICIYVWNDFYFYQGGVYKHRWGTLKGGHVVTITGYNDSQQCWIVKNSWGTKWGDNGYFKMAYDADMFIDGCYGGETAIMYLDEVYGNLQPDVPNVQIQTPTIYKTYLFGYEFKTLFKKLPVQEAAPRIFGRLRVNVSAENTNYVEFYLDDELLHTDYESPYELTINPSFGLYTLEVRAHNEQNVSLDIVDIFVFI